MARIEEYKVVKVDNKVMRNEVKNLIIQYGRDVLNKHITAVLGRLHKQYGFSEVEHISMAQVQDAFSYYKFSPQQKNFREKYNY